VRERKPRRHDRTGADPADGDGWDRGDDHLGLFDGDSDGGPATGEVDLDELRRALAGNDHEAQEPSAPVSRTAARREHRARQRRHRQRTVRSTLVAIVVMVLILAAVAVGVLIWRNKTAAPTDWAGTGSKVVVVRVQSGDGLVEIGQTLAGAGVVADAATFVHQASGNDKMKALQPGFYMVHQHSAAQVVVAELADPKNRVGQMRVIPGQTLADRTAVSTSGKTTIREGIISTITDACVPTNGQKQCFSKDDLWKVAQTASLSDLGVVGWAVDGVRKAPDPRKRLEGVILPGNYDIAPGSTAKQALFTVVSASASAWNTTGIAAAAKDQDVSAYQLATIASLIEGEGRPADMPKIARVIDNRLAIDMKLQLDATVNYGLNRAQISTTNAERLDPANIYSTYAHAGLTPTPIGSPGPDALDAAVDPATGTWLYFVAVDTDGHTCFSTTEAEHQQCVEKARANGVFG
jgi:UPF0755 protein